MGENQASSIAALTNEKGHKMDYFTYPKVGNLPITSTV